ncbi:MAG: fatty acid desaturase [Deltaproteobacteria bacterium]|nr:fatty acid desaturase [Deltaproteobacteria bacterium]
MKQINWTNTIFLIATPIIALTGVPYLIWTGRLHGATWILALGMSMITGLSITAGYHRLFTHRSYEARWLLRLFFLIFGAASFENSAKHWCSDHREHHLHVDQEPDPYNINKGFLWAHLGWVFFKKPSGHVINNIPDLMKDPLIRFQDRYYYPIALLAGFALPAGIASLWGDPWGGLLLAGVARTVFNHHATFLINSFCHFIGRQPYSDQDTSKDSWLMAFLTFGEGFHNFHHAFQADYRNGFRFFHWDPTKWMIWILAKARLAKNLRRIPKEKILLAKLRLKEKREQASRGVKNLIEGIAFNGDKTVFFNHHS